MSAVVVVDAENLVLPKGVNDSKQVTAKRREALFMDLCCAVLDIGIGSVEPWDIDAMGPKFALQECYRRALSELRVTPDILIVDGNEWMNKVKWWKGDQLVEKKADVNFKEVSIASIIAKVIRDRVMCERAKKLRDAGFPDWNWAVNKGYLTPDHLREIERFGLTFGPAIYQHRRSYSKNLLGKVKVFGDGTC